jgi:hypothetical protein
LQLPNAQQHRRNLNLPPQAQRLPPEMLNVCNCIYNGDMAASARIGISHSVSPQLTSCSICHELHFRFTCAAL